MNELVEMDDLKARCQREIVELHLFLGDWFNGALEGTDEALARFGGVLAPGFVIVGPDGSTRDRSAILEVVKSSHASAKGPAPIRIWIENVQVIQHVGDITIVTYEEWRDGAGEAKRGRLSTVIFRADDLAPHGLMWLHVHETWLEIAEE